LQSDTEWEKKEGEKNSKNDQRITNKEKGKRGKGKTDFSRLVSLEKKAKSERQARMRRGAEEKKRGEGKGGASF